MRYEIKYELGNETGTFEITDHGSDMDLWSLILEQHPVLYDDLTEYSILSVKKISDTIRWMIETQSGLSWKIETPDHIDLETIAILGLEYDSESADWLKEAAPDLYRYYEAGKIHDVRVIE